MYTDYEKAMNSWLIYRYLYDTRLTFDERILPNFYEPDGPYYNVSTSDDIESSILDYIKPFFENEGDTALMLSGGIDSGILASYVPKKTMAFTMTDGNNTSEVAGAKKYVEANNLRHEIISTGWDDYKEYAPMLMRQKGAPIHSIEVQIYKTAVYAREQGYNFLLFGELADTVFGGLSGLFLKDWTIDEFFHRYAFVDPFRVLKKPLKLDEPIRKSTGADGLVDTHGFLNWCFLRQSAGGYTNPCDLAKIKFLAPYGKMRMAEKLDVDRVRYGDNKYLIRELFNRRYPDFIAPEKTPMPRAVDEYLADWSGPIRPEFLEHIDISKLTGDEKWYIYCLEWFLDIIENEDW